MDLRRTDMGLLIALDALLSERGVTRAARRLGISQPALSAQLAKLRYLFNDPLIVGNAHGMTPTPRALDLQEPLHQLLSELQTLVTSELAFDPAIAERTFTITATDYVHAAVTQSLIIRLRELAPKLRVSALFLNPQTIQKELEDGATDLCITSKSLTPVDYPAKKLMHERFVLIMCKSHPIASKRMTLDLFCSLEHVLTSPTGGGFHGLVDGELDALGRQRKVVGSLNSFLLVPNLVKSSHCVSVIPESLALAHKEDLAITKIPFEMSGFDLFQSWHPRVKTDKGHIWLRNTIHELLNSAD